MTNVGCFMVAHEFFEVRSYVRSSLCKLVKALIHMALKE